MSVVCRSRGLGFTLPKPGVENEPSLLTRGEIRNLAGRDNSEDALGVGLVGIDLAGLNFPCILLCQ